MHSNDERVEIDLTAPGRRELLAMLCAALNDTLSFPGAWESGCELHHWQATSPDFALLPELIIDAVLEAWSESRGRLDEVELSGYMDTDEGHRAWGFLALRPGQPQLEERPEVATIRVSETEGGFAVSASIRRSVVKGQSSAEG